VSFKFIPEEVWSHGSGAHFARRNRSAAAIRIRTSRTGPGKVCVGSRRVSAALGLSDPEILEREFILYDALYRECRRQAPTGKASTRAVSLFEIASIVRSCDHVWHPPISDVSSGAILLNLTPGPDTGLHFGAHHCARSRGRNCIGRSNFSWQYFHTCAAALGLSAVLATSAVAFGAINIAGWHISYLPWNQNDSRSPAQTISLPSSFRRRTTSAAFRQGILTNILNQRWRSSSWRFFRSSSTLDRTRNPVSLAHLVTPRNDVFSSRVVPRSAVPDPGSMNCGRNARKKSATFGLRILVQDTLTKCRTRCAPAKS